MRISRGYFEHDKIQVNVKSIIKLMSIQKRNVRMNELILKFKFYLIWLYRIDKKNQAIGSMLYIDFKSVVP